MRRALAALGFLDSSKSPKFPKRRQVAALHIQNPRSAAFSVLRELVFKAVAQRQPAGFDDVLADTDGAPDVAVVARLDHHADPGGGALADVDDPDLGLWHYVYWCTGELATQTDWPDPRKVDMT